MNPIFQSVIALLLGPGLFFCLFAALVLSDYYGATRKHLFAVLFCVAVFFGTFSALYCISTCQWKPAVYDESIYINAANFLWQSPFQEQLENPEHPELGKYLIGFGLWANGSLSKDRFCLPWNVDWHDYFDSNRAIPHHIVVESRIVPMLMVSGTSVIVYLIGRRVRELVGILSAVFFISNRFVLGTGWRAILDPVLLFFLTLTWFFLTSQKLSKTRSGLAVIFFGLGFALSMQFQASALVVLYTIVLLLMYGAWRFCASLALHLREPSKFARRVVERVGIFSIAILFAVGLSSVKLFVTLDTLPYIQRGEALERGEIFHGLIPTVGQVFATFVHRPGGEGDYPGGQVLPRPPQEYWFYVGGLFPLALCGALFVRKFGLVIFLLGTVVVSSLLSMGVLLDPLIDLIPFLKMMRVPSRWLILSAFAFPALASVTIDAIQSWLEARVDGKCRGKRMLRTGLSKLFAYGLALLVVLDLATAGIPFVKTVEVITPPSPAMLKMRSDSYFEIFRVHTTKYSNTYQYAKNGFETTIAFDPGDPGLHPTGFAVESYARYLELIRSGSYKLLEPLNVKYVVSDRELSVSHFKFLGAYGDEFLFLNERFADRVQPTANVVLIVCSDQGVWERLSADTMARPMFVSRGTALVWGRRLEDFSLDRLKRFAVVQIHDQKTFDGYASAMREMLDDYVRSGGTVVVSGDPLPDSLLARFADFQGVDLQVNRYTPNRMDVEVSTGVSGVVLVSEVYVPGWRVWVDGREVEILRVDGIFFGFFLEEGVHSLVIEFRPLAYDGWNLLSALSYVGLILVLFSARVKAILGRFVSLPMLRKGVPKPT